MRRTTAPSTLISLCAIGATLLSANTASAQGGSAGGLQGNQQGRLSAQYDGSVDWIERAIGRYLNGNEVKNLMTPGEFSEWKVTLKAGQVVIAEAWSDAFDPALEIVDAKEKVLKSNDDRYPGDQRPVLFWRCEKDGEYSIRARCFQNKFGGQFMFRSNVYKSVAAIGDAPADLELDPNEQFLVRIPMKAGEIKQIVFEVPDGYYNASTYQAISPIGLPDIELPARISPVIGASIVASVDGDYYIHCSPHNDRRGKVRVKAVSHTMVPMTQSGSVRIGNAPTNRPSLWSLSAKAGELIELSVPSLNLAGAFIIEERPDISNYDLKDVKKKNPFFPRVPVEGEVDKGVALIELPGRARDPRRRVFYVRRDCDLWLASGGYGKDKSEYAVTVKPAQSDFVAAQESSGKLRIGDTDYWSFDAKAGDVMTFKSKVDGFAQTIVVRDPDLSVVWNETAAPDQDEFDWNMIVRKPGRYLVAVSALGDGGAGAYSLNRQVFAARTFSKLEPAVGDFSSGQAEIWKFTARPDEPLLIKWTSANHEYSVSIRDENGNNLSLPLTAVDDSNQFGLLKVDRERTYVIVLISNGKKSDYRIELGEIPGYTKKS